MASTTGQRLIALDAKLGKAVEFIRGDKLADHVLNNTGFWEKHLTDPSYVSQVLRHSRTTNKADLPNQAARSIAAFGLRTDRANKRRADFVQALKGAYPKATVK